MPSAIDSLVTYLKENDWNYDLEEGHKLIHTGFTGKNLQFRIAIAVNDADDILEVISLIPNRVPVEKRTLVAELCVRANFGIRLGRLDLDFSDGEVRSHASAPFVTGVLQDEVIRQCLSASILVADHFYPALMAVLYAGATPQAALEALSAESDGDPSEREE